MSTTSHCDKEIESSITFFLDGSVEVRDGKGTPIDSKPEDEFFPVSDVKAVLGIESAVVDVEIRGSHYKIRKIGRRIYKILLPH